MPAPPALPLRFAKLLALLAMGLLVAAALWLTLRGPRRGHLAFEKTESTHQAEPFETETIARFPFQNRGNKQIRILEVKSDCSCTVASLDKHTFAPGERGEIVANFKYGSRTGLQRKGVVVRTDDAEQPLVPLALITSIPEVLTLPTSVLLWTENESLEAKSLVVTTSEHPPVRELRAGTDSPFLTVGVERVSPTEFRVRVTPVANRRDVSAALQLEALLDGDQRKLVNAFVRVR